MGLGHQVMSRRATDVTAARGCNGLARVWQGPVPGAGASHQVECCASVPRAQVAVAQLLCTHPFQSLQAPRQDEAALPHQRQVHVDGKTQRG